MTERRQSIMTDYEIARWTNDHLRDFHNTETGKLAVFKVNSKLVSVPIDRQSWETAKTWHTIMAVLRETVMALATSE